jgi:L-malate glycosyltransferase
MKILKSRKSRRDSNRDFNKNGKSVLIITSSFPVKTGDISGNFIKKQVQCMVNCGYKMVVLTPYIPGSLFFEIQENISIFRFPYFFPLQLHRLCVDGGMYFGFKNSLLGKIQIIPFLISMLFFSGLIIRKKKISMIHTHWIIPQGIIGAFWKIFYNIPHITTAHVLDITITDSIHTLCGLLRWTLKHADAVSVNSSFTRSQVLRFSPPALSVSIIPMGMDDTRILGIKTNCISKNQKHSILFVGRMIEWKGISILIQAIELVIPSIADVKLILIGDGPDLDKFKKQVQSLELDKVIQFRGKLSDSDLNIEYERSDLFILPSITQKNIVMEGLGVVLLEAMASGIPVIGSNTGGIPDIIEDGVNGLLVPPGDPKALALAIIRIFNDSYLAERFRDAGLRTVKERFSWDRIADQFSEIYTKIVEKNNG